MVLMCEKCGDSGLLILDDNTATQCDCMLLKSIQKKLKTSGIPGEKCFTKDFSLSFYSDKLIVEETRKTYLQAAKDALRAVQKFIKNPETDGLCLIGPAGRGKTFLARCAAHELMAKGKNLIFIVVPDLLSEIRSTYNSDAEHSEIQILEAARKVDILFLDDLGAHNYTEWVRNQLYSILNYRMNNNLPTFITSNLTQDEMYQENKLGDRITSRIIALCEFHFINSDYDLRVLKRQHKTKVG